MTKEEKELLIELSNVEDADDYIEEEEKEEDNYFVSDFRNFLK